MPFLTDDEALRMDVLLDIDKERTRQEELWGKQDHDWGTWLAIVGEEHGEVCQAIQRVLGLVSSKETDAAHLYKECIHLAAVSAKMAEKAKEEEREKEKLVYFYPIGEVVKHKDAAFSEEFKIVSVAAIGEDFDYMIQGPKPKYTEPFPVRKEKLIPLEGTSL
jgi:hypothetical protein